MPVLYPAFCGHQQCHQFICAFTLLSVPCRNAAMDIQSQVPPMPLDFHFIDPPPHPLAVGIQKSHVGTCREGYMYFLESTIVDNLLVETIYMYFTTALNTAL